MVAAQAHQEQELFHLFDQQFDLPSVPIQPEHLLCRKVAGLQSAQPLWIVFAGLFVNRFGSFVTAFLVLYLISRGYTLTQAGAAVSAYGIGSIGASAFGGYCADWLGRRNTIIFSMFSSAATMLLLSQTSTLLLIILLVGLAGLTTDLYRPAASALIADLVPSGQRVRAYALSRFCINLGFAAGPAVAGLLASRSFLLLFVGDALTSVLFGLLALFALPTGMHSHGKQDLTQSGLFPALRSDRRFLLFLFASLMISKHESVLYKQVIVRSRLYQWRKSFKHFTAITCTIMLRINLFPRLDIEFLTASGFLSSRLWESLPFLGSACVQVRTRATSCGQWFGVRV